MSEEQIVVYVYRAGDRANYMMQFRDPMTGKKVSRSTGIKATDRKKELDDAQKVAGKWQSELREGRYAPPSRTTWAEFRDKYEQQVGKALAPATFDKIGYVFDSVEASINPQRVRDVNAARIMFWQTQLREQQKSESTIKSYSAHLKAALRWAVDQGYLPKAPKIDLPPRATDKPKGRAITGEELDRMLVKLPSVLGFARPLTQPHAAIVASWEFYLRGLYASGLRLSESLELYWDRDDRLCIDLSGRHPMLRIPAAMDKGNKERTLPLSPEFAELLAIIPDDQRTGRVFNPSARRKHGDRLGVFAVSKLISEVATSAGVKVGTSKAGKSRFAGAHDFRRAFGERWASRVMPQVLMELMRHESIETTLKFYAAPNAQRTANVLWDAHRAANANSLPNTQRTDVQQGEPETSQVVEQTKGYE